MGALLMNLINRIAKSKWWNDANPEGITGRDAVQMLCIQFVMYGAWFLLFVWTWDFDR